MPYNGYANYETWNCAMFLGLEPFYHTLKAYCESEKHPHYTGFLDFAGLVGKENPDGVYWGSPSLDVAALDEVVTEYRKDTFGLE